MRKSVSICRLAKKHVKPGRLHKMWRIISALWIIDNPKVVEID
jgi:hypothetical protein